MDNSSSSIGETANPINAIAVPIFCLLATLITYLPFRAFKRLGNFPACNLIVVNNIINIFYFINAILWPNDNWSTWWAGYGLCDVEIILKSPLTVALACSLCRLTQGMANALDVDNAQFNTTAAMKRRKLLFDLLACWGVPLWQICMHYTVQDGRYAIAPVFGCGDQLDTSWPVVFIYLIWFPPIMLLNLYYAALILIRLRRHRKNISGALTTTGSGMAPKKFIKMITISFSLLCIYLPVQCAFFTRSVPPELTSYSWSGVHNPASWDPILFVHTSDYSLRQYYGWSSVAWNFTIFLFFGFNEEAVDTYRGWMVKCGLSKIWPSLKEPRQPRRPGSPARTSLSSHFDLVGKAMHYFDGNSRKESQTTTLGGCRGSESSRKGSQGTFDHIALTNITTNVSSNHSQHRREAGLSTNTLTRPSDYLGDLITPAPSPIAQHTISLIPEQSEPIFTMPVRKPGNIFSTFRTHNNLPTPLFTRTPKSSQQPTANLPAIATNRSIRQGIDLEAQHSSLVAPTTVSTQIWSGPSPSSTQTPHPGTPFPPPYSSTPHSHTNTNTNTNTHSNNASQDLDLDLDPTAPKMGTRAYRERERREFEAQKKEGKKEMTKVLADNVRVEMGIELLDDEEVGKNSGKGKEGVVVKARLERREEDA